MARGAHVERGDLGVRPGACAQDSLDLREAALGQARGLHVPEPLPFAAQAFEVFVEPALNIGGLVLFESIGRLQDAAAELAHQRGGRVGGAVRFRPAQGLGEPARHAIHVAAANSGPHVGLHRREGAFRIEQQVDVLQLGATLGDHGAVAAVRQPVQLAARCEHPRGFAQSQFKIRVFDAVLRDQQVEAAIGKGQRLRRRFADESGGRQLDPVLRQEARRIDLGEVDAGQRQFAPRLARGSRPPDQQHTVAGGDVQHALAGGRLREEPRPVRLDGRRGFPVVGHAGGQAVLAPVMLPAPIGLPLSHGNASPTGVS